MAIKARLDSLVSIMVLLKQVFSLRRELKQRSAIAVEKGMISRSLRVA